MTDTTVITYLLKRLSDLGIRDIFGIPGDYSFPITDAIVEHKEIRWRGSCNELNAAYAADGYARVKGFGAITTAFGVGELSAINGIAGSFSEHVPVFHIAGAPKRSVQQKGSIVHHSLGTGEFDKFHEIARHSAGASSILTAENAFSEIERLIHVATTYRRPVYMALASDVAQAPIQMHPLEKPKEQDPAILQACAEAIADKINRAKRVTLLPGIFLHRFNATSEAQKFVEASGLAFATMMSDKTVFDETHPQYIGMYNGSLMNPDIQKYVEDSDCIVAIGTLLSDFNTGAFTSTLSQDKLILIGPHSVQIGHAQFKNVSLKPLLTLLTKLVKKRKVDDAPKPASLGQPIGKKSDPITPEYLFPRYEAFIKPDDAIVIETGSQHMGLAFGLMKKGVSFHNQTLWCSIGWATCAALGAAVALEGTNRRVIMITGEGAHQFTLQELSVFQRYNLKPIIICVNNDGYMIERKLCKDPMAEYNDIPAMNYHLLPEAFGCKDWYTKRVTTCGELDEALLHPDLNKRGAYIEVMMDKMAAPPFVERLHERVEQFHK